MLAFLKTIFGGRTARPPQGNVGLAMPRTVYTPPPRPEHARRPAQTARPTPKPQPAPAPAPVPVAAPDSDSALGSDVDISLQAVLRGLPADLKDRVRDLDIRGATMTISLERILAQLPSGSVRISFGSLRHAAPQLFSVGADCDSRDVTLPLDEILAKINPAMICRPHQEPAQRFEHSTTQPSDDAETRTEPVARPASVGRASPPAEPQTLQRGSSLSVPPISAPGESADAPEVIPPATSRNVTPKPKPVSKAPPIRVPTPQAAKSQEPLESVEATASLTLDLASVTQAWPLKVREQISEWNLAEAKIALPNDTVSEGMKRGRLAFPWKILRSWITPAPPAGKSAHDKVTLELPLAVIAPLFLAATKPRSETGSAKHGRETSAHLPTREEIPDLFFDARKGEHPNGENGHDVVAPIAPPQAAPVVPPEVAPVALRPEVAESRDAVAALAPKTSSAPAPSSQPVADQAVMRIPLKELTGLWPESVRIEVAHWNLDQLMVALPAEQINAGLKQGKVIFTWENLRSWILPSPPSATSLQDQALLELPLPIIMPLFLAARNQFKPIGKPQPQIADDIPDPFADFLPPAATAPRQEKVSPEPAAHKSGSPDDKAPTKSAAAPPVIEKSGNTKTFTREQIPVSEPRSRPASREEEASAPAAKPQVQSAGASPEHASTPAEVLATAIGLEGVAGALVALADGFKVVSKLPPGIDGDSLAAFLPHIFSKVNQSARELRMGDLNNLNFTVDNVPWKIFRVNQIFFAALGHAGKPMPTDQLAVLAHKLTFRN